MFGILSSALLIFFLRMVDISFYTLRILMVVRGRKPWAWLFGFFQSITYIFSLQAVLRDISNPYNVLGYVAGFATGLVVGMLIENRLALGHLLVRVVSARHGIELAERLRNAGYAVTEVSAHGRDGMVSLLFCNVLRRHLDEVLAIVSGSDTQAFITVENVHPLQHGFWRA